MEKPETRTTAECFLQLTLLNTIAWVVESKPVLIHNVSSLFLFLPPPPLVPSFFSFFYFLSANKFFLLLWYAPSVEVSKPRELLSSNDCTHQADHTI